MNRRIVAGVAVALLALIVVGAIGTAAYRAGVARGLADAGRLPSPEAGSPVPYGPYYGPFRHHGPWGFGFVGFLFPLLAIVVVISLIRALSWRRWCAGPYGPSTSGVPPAFEEWHRRAHDSARERPQSP
jgi:hypothetical protein